METKFWNYEITTAQYKDVKADKNFTQTSNSELFAVAPKNSFRESQETWTTRETVLQMWKLVNYAKSIKTRNLILYNEKKFIEKVLPTYFLKNQKVLCHQNEIDQHRTIFCNPGSTKLLYLGYQTKITIVMVWRW